jgi:hypothetical protein
VRQWREWNAQVVPGDRPVGQQILVAVARWQAAHSPTPRAQLQTAEVARRLSRGQSLYADQDTD